MTPPPRAPRLLDPDGRPLKRAELSQEHARPQLTGVRQAWRPQSIAAGLTPDRLAAVLRAADRGEHNDYLTLAAEMEERDAHYAAVLGVRKRAVSALQPEVEAAADTPRDIERADALRRLTADPAFPALLEDCLDALGKGFAAIEIIWRRGAQWTPQRYAWRDPRWFRWNRDDGRTLRLLTAQDASHGLPLAPAKWIVHLPRLRSGLPARGGLARTAAAAYLIKAYALTDWTAFAEVFGMPLRLGRYGSAATENDIAMLIGAVANLGSDAAAVIPDSMRVEFQQPSSGSGSGADVFRDLAQYADSQISKAVLGQTMTTDDGASRAQAEVHDAVRGDILAADARQLTATLNRDLARPFIDLNFGPQQRYPRITLPITQPEDTAALTAALEKLVPLGLPVQASLVRDKLGIPDPQHGALLLHPPNRPDAFAPAANAAHAAAAAQSPSLPPADIVDDLAHEALEDWEEQTRPLVEQIERLLDQADDLADFRARLSRFIDSLDVNTLTEMLSRAGFAAEVAARLGAR